MKRIALLAAAVGVVSAAHAQATADYTPTNLSVRLGFGYPLDDAVRDLTKTLIGVGVDFRLNTALIKGSETFISADWLGKSGNGAKGNIFPIMINQKFNSSMAADIFPRTYGFVGVGVAIIDVKSTSTAIGARGGFGVEFGPNIFSEATLVISDNAGGAKANTVGLYIGYRF